MKFIWIKFVVLLIVLHSSFFYSQAQKKFKLSKDVVIEEIEAGVWRHISYNTLPKIGPFYSNGLIIKFGPDVLLVDSANNDKQTKLILDWIEKNLKVKPSFAVITHHHKDRLGGIHEIHHRHIQTVALKSTAELAKQKGNEPPQKLFDEKMNLSLDHQDVQLRYLGPGHTQDNIVVWIPSRKILFGGCLIKSLQAESLGNIEDADLKNWPETMKKIYKEFPDVQIVIPGHGDIAGIDAVEHTLELLEKH